MRFANPVGVPAVRHSDARILVVDDEPEYLRLLQSILQDLLPDADIITAPDAWKARWERSRLAAPLLVISDHRMPGERGLDMLTDLARDRRAGECFVLLTSFINDIGVEAALAAGLDDVLEKPFNLDDLEVLLARLVAAWGARVEAAKIHV